MRTVHRVAVTTRTSIERKVVKQILKILLLFIFFFGKQIPPTFENQKAHGVFGGKAFSFWIFPPPKAPAELGGFVLDLHL